MNPPRTAAPYPNGTYIPEALLNLLCEWVSISRLRQWVYAQCFQVDPPTIEAGSQKSVYWRGLCERFSLETRRANQTTTARILKHVNEKCNILENQIGFLRGHSSVHALGRLHNAICNGFNECKYTAFVSLDHRSTFDTVRREPMSLGFPLLIVKTV